ncbi:MAG: phosphoribosylamine--glycine ligase family protein, partial [Desulfovibrionaceae bacterium]|nr:phosphoribosylamine--glycine ligase family protein [Desulfovibrionaceae bacterium]
MRILVIGSGGREHSLVWKLAQSPKVSEIIVAPGNGGMEMAGVRTVPVPADDISGLCRLARKEKVDLVIPGPELPLTEGIVDAMDVLGIACFGPDRFCARMEGSKLFAKQTME